MSEGTEAVESAEIGQMDLDWDSDVEDFPALPEGSTEDEGSSEESEDNVSEVSGEEAKPESVEAPEEAEESQSKDKSGESESGEEDSKQEVKSLEDFSDDDVIQVKVDGELQELSIKEFKNGISGEKAIAKRFSEYDRKEKELKTEVNEINSYVNEFAQKMQTKDPVGALEYLAQFSGTPAYEVKDMLIEALLPEIDRRAGLQQEQLQFEKQEAKLKFDTEQREAEFQKNSAEQASKELELKISGVQQTHSISQEDWNDAFSYLDKNLPASETITVDTVKERILFSRAEDALTNVDSKLASNSAIISHFVELQGSNPDFNQEDLIAIAKDAFGYNEKESAKDELQEVSQKKVETKTKTQKKESLKPGEPSPLVDSMGEEITDWDDLL